jgi:two-component system response regulator PilR (NtrC family)
VIASTNRRLEAMVAEGRFREDLFYRLNVIPLRLPGLRERREDIPLLAEHFLQGFRREMGKGVLKISKEAMDCLSHHDWPGNVRELENVMERAVALETTEVILPERLPASLHAPPTSAAPPELREGFSLDEYLLSVEASLVRNALSRASGDRARASKALGITPRSLRYLIQKHGLEAEGRARGA